VKEGTVGTPTVSAIALLVVAIDLAVMALLELEVAAATSPTTAPSRCMT